MPHIHINLTMETNIINDGGTLTAVLKGRLDTLSTPDFEKSIAPLRENADKKLVLECKELEYISSSGLRVFLALLKQVKGKGGDLLLTHVNSEIRNIFSITGFHKLFTIQD